MMSLDETHDQSREQLSENSRSDAESSRREPGHAQSAALHPDELPRPPDTAVSLGPPSAGNSRRESDNSQPAELYLDAAVLKWETGIKSSGPPFVGEDGRYLLERPHESADALAQHAGDGRYRQLALDTAAPKMERLQESADALVQQLVGWFTVGSWVGSLARLLRIHLLVGWLVG